VKIDMAIMTAMISPIHMTAMPTNGFASAAFATHALEIQAAASSRKEEIVFI
jgi:hypothetical protein